MLADEIIRKYTVSLSDDQMNIVMDDGAFAPIRAHEDDAGLDLRSPVSVLVDPFKSVVIDTGIRVQIPKGYYGKLESKSGLHVNHDIVCC